jgi:hypothetical protein
MAAKVKEYPAIEAPENESIEATEPAATEPAATPPAPQPEKPAQSQTGSGIAVYIGPTIHGKIQSGAVFKGGKAEAEALYADAIAKYPAIARLIVPAERLASAREEIRLQKGLIHKHYKELAGRAQGK